MMLGCGGWRASLKSHSCAPFNVKCLCVMYCVCTGRGNELNKCVHPWVVTVPVQVKTYIKNNIIVQNKDQYLMLQCSVITIIGIR